MLTGIPKVKVGALVAVLAGALCVAGVGPATASAKLVKSDSVSFKGTVNSTGEWLTTKCKLTSDGEFVPGTTKLQVFPCELQGQALGIGGSVIEVGSLWKSSDGIAGFPFQAVPRTKSEPPKETYAGTVNCEEEEEEEGKVVRYPCQAKVKLVFNTLKHTVTGKYVIYEESTQP